jgi:hypothetical protein
VLKTIGPSAAAFFCQKCSKTHVRASVTPKKFSGSLYSARHKGERKGGEGEGREGRGWGGRDGGRDQCRINTIQGPKPDWWKVTAYINDVIFTQQHRYYLK